MIGPWELHRRLLMARSRPLDPLAGPILVVAPHPDDETIGAGALIARAAADGVEVRVLVVSDGGASHSSLDRSALVERRQAETIEACARLGVASDSVRFLGLPDQDVAGHRAQVFDALASHRDVRWVVGPSGRDANPDHRATAAAIIETFGRSGGPGLLWYPVWYWHRWAWMDPRRSRVIRAGQLLTGPVAALASTATVTLEDPEALASKAHALDAYSSQLSGHEDDPGSLDPSVVARARRSPELLFTVRGTDGVLPSRNGPTLESPGS